VENLGKRENGAQNDSLYEGRDEQFNDIDRMVSEGLGGGYVTEDDNGLIEETTTDTMDQQESVLEEAEIGPDKEKAH
jgi:hypothetical protein